jgi:hypothetical protein
MRAEGAVETSIGVQLDPSNVHVSLKSCDVEVWYPPNKTRLLGVDEALVVVEEPEVPGPVAVEPALDDDRVGGLVGGVPSVPPPDKGVVTLPKHPPPQRRPESIRTR